MKILVTPNSFKESLTSIEVARHIGKGLRKASRKYRVVEVPLADGGTGTTKIITDIFDGTYITCPVTDPIGKKIDAFYGSIPGQRVAVIELAQSSGLSLVSQKKRAPMTSSTTGVGQMIIHALQRGHKKFIIGIGDSATIDCGVGALSELGIQFLDARGKSIGTGCSGLLQLRKIDKTRLNPRSARARMTIASDVKNVLTGKHGAILYAKQKGVRTDNMPTVRKALKNYKRVIMKQFGIDLDTIPGSGAAGGIGGAFVVLLNAQIVSGFGLIKEFVRLEEEIATSDIVITGEGRIDEVSMCNKALRSVIDMAKMYGKPIFLVAGSVARNVLLKTKYTIPECYSLVRGSRSKQYAIKNAGTLLEQLAYQIGQDIKKKF